MLEMAGESRGRCSSPHENEGKGAVVRDALADSLRRTSPEKVTGMEGKRDRKREAAVPQGMLGRVEVTQLRIRSDD